MGLHPVSESQILQASETVLQPHWHHIVYSRPGTVAVFFTYSFNPPYNPPHEIGRLLPFYKLFSLDNWGTGRWSNLPEETQLVNSKPKPRQSGCKVQFLTTTLHERLCVAVWVNWACSPSSYLSSSINHIIHDTLAYILIISSLFLKYRKCGQRTKARQIVLERNI